MPRMLEHAGGSGAYGNADDAQGAVGLEVVVPERGRLGRAAHICESKLKSAVRSLARKNGIEAKGKA